ncbi:hypothetical protein VTK73DRAFT_2151 [Phialemonium thermophilum]|uniref:Protein kinase domain-containing protein n=1 Tax=Phialemonium thermophilum TaxID=223376 RepID=A0ABR3VSH1_9PEZI
MGTEVCFNDIESLIDEILIQRERPFTCVYLARTSPFCLLASFRRPAGGGSQDQRSHCRPQVDILPPIRSPKALTGDLENATTLAPGKSIQCALPGNHLWRSPEAHVRARVRFPSDVFSFGVVVHILADDEKKSVTYVLEKQFCYFGDGPGVAGLRAHVGPDSVWQSKFVQIMSRLICNDNPPRTFVGWADVEDASFRDVVGRMTRLDPSQRITAQEALKHPWFRDVVV